MIYKFIVGTDGHSPLQSAIQRLSDSAFIPFDPANTDYQQFKTDVMDGAELQDAEGVTMTQEEAEAFIATLP